MKEKQTKKYDYEVASFSYEGKRYFPRGKTKEEAIENKIKLKAKLDAGRAAAGRDRNTTLKAWSVIWLPRFKADVATSTYNDIQSRLDKRILPKLGHQRMKDITPSDIQDVINDMAGMSEDRILKVLQVIKQLFDTAVEEGIILKSPSFRNVKLPGTAKEDGIGRAITPYEREITLKVAEYHFAGPFVLTLLYCGLRPQEAAALQGRHIDLVKMQITVEQARKTEGNIGTPKSTAGKRIIPIPPPLAPRLPKADPYEYVFKSAKGHSPVNRSHQQKMWNAFKRELNIAAGCKVYRNELLPSMTLAPDCKHSCLLMYPDYIRDGFGERDFPIMDDLAPYCYRHTFATDAVTAGVPIELLKDLMGHERISTTAKYYIHMTDERLNQAAILLSNYHAKK